MAVIEKLKAKASKYKMASVAKIAFFWGGSTSTCQVVALFIVKKNRNQDEPFFYSTKSVTLHIQLTVLKY